MPLPCCPCGRNSKKGKDFGASMSKYSSNPSRAVRSDRIHAVFHRIPPHGPDESGHYERVGRMFTSINSSGGTGTPLGRTRSTLL